MSLKIKGITDFYGLVCKVCFCLISEDIGDKLRCDILGLKPKKNSKLDITFNLLFKLFSYPAKSSYITKKAIAPAINPIAASTI
jgi:hypothetical protein